VPAVYDTPEQLLDTEQLDFIDIITDVETHAPLVKLAAAHKLPVICQKPMAPSLEIAQSMVDACHAAGVPLFIHENWRWQTPIREVQRVLATGVIGQPFRARIDMISGFEVFANQPFLKTLDQFILTDLGSHILDVARSLFGEAESLICQAFGYAHSDLREWIAEKYGAQPVPPITSITLETLRIGGPTAVTEHLRSVTDGAYVIVNAAAYRDLEVFVAGLIDAEGAGKHFIARSAASYMRVRAGMTPHGLLTPAELRGAALVPGVIVAGSYIAKSSAQIAHALALPNVGGVEVQVTALLDEAQRSDEIRRAIAMAHDLYNARHDALIYTSRAFITGLHAHGSLQIGQVVSAVLVEIVRGLPFRPGWIVAKGGITSSDIATAALRIRRAWVIGQALPGVPVWRADDHSLWPGLTYVVFPGNVGDESALARVISLFSDS